MTSKLTEWQLRNNQMLVKAKLLPHVKQEQAADPWTFLEAVDAPQWVDLSLEPRSIGKDSVDSWFGEIHEHHAISLAGRNRSMSWVSLGKPCLDKQRNQSVISKSKGKGKGNHIPATKVEKKQIVGHLKVSDDGHLTKVEDVQSQTKASYSNSANRTSSVLFYSSVPHGSVDTASTFSGSSSTCEYESEKSLRKRSSGSDLQSVTRSSQGFPIKSKSLVIVRRGSSKHVEDPYGTPMCYASGGQRGRSSSSASSSTHLPKSSYSLESGNSTCTTLTTCKLGASTLGHSPDLDVSQPACHEERQFSGESLSDTSCISQEPVRKGGARIQEGESPYLQEVKELEGIIICKQPSETVDIGLPGLQHSAKETVKRGLKVGTQSFGKTRASQIGLLPRKQLYSGKENAPPSKNLTAGNFLQAKDRFCPTKAPLTFVSSELATSSAKCDISKGNLGKGSCAPQISQKAGRVQAALFEGGVSHPVKASSCAPQRKKGRPKQVSARGCTSNDTRECERDLAALVAQHNQKVRTLRLQGCWKGLR